VKQRVGVSSVGRTTGPLTDFAGMSSTERKTALATLLNLLPGVDRRDKAKEVMNYQKCYNVIEFVSMTDADIESFTLSKKDLFVNMAFLPLNHVVNNQLRNCLFTTWFSGKKAMLTLLDDKRSIGCAKDQFNRNYKHMQCCY